MTMDPKKKIIVAKPTDRLIGAVRLPLDTYNKVIEIAKRLEVSNQEVVRAILNQTIDEVDVSLK